MPSRQAKGKGRAGAGPSERTPLLPFNASRLNPELPAAESRRYTRARSIIGTTIIVLLSLFIAAMLLLALLAYSFKPSDREMETLPKTAFAYSGPDSIQVLDVSDEGILVNVTIHCGLDADQALGISQHRNRESELGEGIRGTGAGWWESLRRWTAHHAMDQLSTKAVEVDMIEPVLIFPDHFQTPPLVLLQVMDPIMVPLITGVKPNTPWLQPVSFTAVAQPVASAGDLWKFVQRAWAEGEASVVIGMFKVLAQLPDGPWWTKLAKVIKEDLIVTASFDGKSMAASLYRPPHSCSSAASFSPDEAIPWKRLTPSVPRIPGLPRPGKHLDLSQLVSLTGYSLSTSPSKALTITASATIPNPLQNISANVPYNFPFSISLSDGSVMAEVLTAPLVFGDQSEARVLIGGEIVANLTERGAADGSPLSSFLRNYLHGLDNPIIVRGLSRIPSFAHKRDVTPPPSWILDSIPSLSLDLTFPGPQPPPRIIKTVSIEKMRLAEKSGKMALSGIVVAEIELPEGMQGVSIDVKDVLPDVLIYDGPVSDEGPDEPDPDSPPPRAFGRINPDDFVGSTTENANDPEHPHRMVVRAPLKDVPLQVLQGRDNVLSDFVSKVVFKGGASAGIRGVASVHVQLAGVDGQVLLDDLPVRGEFWVGRQR